MKGGNNGGIYGFKLGIVGGMGGGRNCGVVD
jgi:hypothetical protein